MSTEDKLMRAIVSIPKDTTIPEDICQNVWHFDGDEATGATDVDYHSGVMTLLTTFYQVVDQYFSAAAASPATVKIYDMRDTKPRVPEYEGTIALTPDTAGLMPTEVALCLSYRAEQVSGESPARRRGRIYLGPLSANVGALVSNDFRPTTAARGIIAGAAATLEDGIALASGVGSVKWAVYSPTIHQQTGDIEAAFNDVVDGWVDDAFDTQRRRGPKATTRTTFT
jgi:hypothetical protein